LQSAASINNHFDMTQGMVLFLAITKVIQSLKFNRRLSFILTTISMSKREMVGFTVFFTVIYTAFCRYQLHCLNLALLWHSRLVLLSINREVDGSKPDLQRVLHSAVVEVAILLQLLAGERGSVRGDVGQVQLRQDRERLVARWVKTCRATLRLAAPWFFFLFMVLQAMILINMLVTIVTNYFAEVRNDPSCQDDESALAAMFVAKLRRVFGMEERPDRLSVKQPCEETEALDVFNRRADMLMRRVRLLCSSAA